jgi:hypothetical protein
VEWTPEIRVDGMDKETLKFAASEPQAEPKYAALRYIMEAWEEAVFDGIDPDCVATAAIFAAMSDLIGTYGEEPVARMAERLPERIRAGEFTLNKTRQ